MRLTRAGSLLLTLGALVGVVASIGLVLGFEPSRLPPALLNVAAYKLTFLAAFGLIAGGAVVVRYGRRESQGGAAVGAPRGETGRLPPGQDAPPPPQRDRDAERVRSATDPKRGPR